MIKIEKTEVAGWEHAIRGMRNPMNSWDKSDSDICKKELCDYETDCTYCESFVSEDGDYFYCADCLVGPNDLELMNKLTKAGTDHRKFMRMIVVYADVTAGHTWWAEYDTYKVGTVRNSCSKMHKIHVKEFVADDFDHEGIDEVDGRTRLHFANTLIELEWLRNKFNETGEKKYWRALIEMLPMGYHLRATVMLNYEVLANMYHSRRFHKLDEWREFCKWIESLPYSELITGGD